TLPNAINKNFTKSPTVSLSPPIKNMPSYVVVGESVLFTVPSATGGLPPYTYSWEFYNAKGTSYTTATGQSTTHIFNTAGTYKVVAMVTDAVGNIANTTTSVLVYNPLTITSTASSANVIINQPVIFTYSISGGSGVYYLSWNLGNGVIGSSPVVLNPGTITTTYTNPGKYLAVFTVNDSAGMTARSTYSINVSYAQTNSTMAPLKAYTVINTTPYATSNISSVYIDTEVYDTVYISGGTGTYFVTINWGDGTSTIANNYITVPVVVYTHTYYKPAIYAITVNVTDSLGHNVTTTEFLYVSYKAPEDWLGYYYNATTDSYLSGTAVFPSNNTLTVNVSQASSGIELAGLIKYGELPYSWKLSNVTATLATGTQAYPGIFPLINSTFTKFTTNVPGIYHFGLSVTDNIGNTNTSASLTIIVTPQYLHLVIAPTSESVSIGTTVIFYLTLYNIKLNSTGYANVTFQFNNGTVPTNWTYTHMFKGTPNAILYPYSVGASGYNVPLTNSKVTYKIVGKFTAFGTANYGTTVNTSAAASYNKVSSTITVVPYQAISVTQGTIPYPPVAQVTTPLIVWTNITGGNGYYNITVNASRGMGIVRLPSTYDFGATLTQWGYDNEIYSITNGKYGEISTTPFVPYANITFTIYYTKAGTWSLYGNITNPTGISAFKYPFIIDFHILPPPALNVTMTGSSHFSYASYTTFNLYLNVSGSSLP
ncbi:MAG: PKD domain-containing protein, partial [Candidatus Micrarchaeaceae archaeon]